MKKILILSAILSSLSLASDLGAEIYISDERPAVFKEEMKAEIISGRRASCVSTIFRLKSIKTRTTIMTFWNVCNVAMETSQNGWYGI